jgi:hypothetical protein
MASESSSNKAVSRGTNITFSFVTIIVLLAFMGGTMFGKAARQLFVTMFSPDVVVVPNTDK